MSETFAAFPHLSEATPAFNAKTTHGDRSLADCKGKWLILFSHTADFTPVCTALFIDPEGILRAMACCPMSNDRSIVEFVRLLQAMRSSDKNAIATPEDWTPGREVIVPPPKTFDRYFSSRTL